MESGWAGAALGWRKSGRKFRAESQLQGRGVGVAKRVSVEGKEVASLTEHI